MSYLNKNDPAVLWYVKDFLADTQILSNEDIGILMRFKALFFTHGRIDRKAVKQSIGTIPDSLNKLILVDSNDKLYCPDMEKVIRERKEHSERKSNDGKKGNEVKSLMKEIDCTKEEARQILEETKGYKFGKDKHTPSDTPSERNKGNAIGDRSYSSSSNDLYKVFMKHEDGQILTQAENELVLKIKSGQLML